MENRKIRVLLADDHTILRQGLRLLLSKEPDMAVVAEASNGMEAVSMSRKFQPDVVVMDIAMPDLNGIDATRKILADAPAIKVLCLSMHRQRSMIQAILDAGASGFLLKTDAGEELVLALRAIMAGGVYLSPMVAGLALRRSGNCGENCNDDVFRKLSGREREVLQQIAEGRNTKEIADRLYINPKTVLAHRSNLMEKLGLSSNAALTLYALRQGIKQL